MIRQALTIAFCAALFSLILAVPVRADHAIGAPYACATLEAAERTVAYVEAEEFDELRARAQSDNDFKCYLFPRPLPFTCTSIVREYLELGVQKAVLLCYGPAGREAYIFGPLDFALSTIHQYKAE